jgi:hypothetical protein
MDLMAMRTLVRRDLKDEDNANYRWQDNEVDRAAQRAVAQLSRYIPLEIKTSIATIDGSREIDIGALADRVSVDRVEFPAGRFPRQFQPFVSYGDTVFLTGEVAGDGTDCCVYWSKMHTLDAQSSTVPAYMEDVLALGAAAYAVLSQAQYRTDVAGIGGDRADTDYQGWGNALMKEFKKQLRRFGRSRRLKLGRLYPGDGSE